MTRPEALNLRAFAGWTIFIWVTRIKNILENPANDTAFKAVHSALALVSVLLAVAALYVVSRNRKRTLTKI